MTGNSEFESRTGKLSGTSEEVFDFVTDIRNFEQFVPAESIGNWQADRESCSFNVPMLGIVSFRLTEEVRYSKVVFNGDALKKNDFTLILNISGNDNNFAEVSVNLVADLNPLLRMMAEKPIGQFLENLIREMESFRDWKNIK